MERKDLGIAVLVVLTGVATGAGGGLLAESINSIGEAISRHESNLAYSSTGNRRFLNPNSIMTGESHLEDQAARRSLVITPIPFIR